MRVLSKETYGFLIQSQISLKHKKGSQNGTLCFFDLVAEQCRTGTMYESVVNRNIWHFNLVPDESRHK